MRGALSLIDFFLLYPDQGLIITALLFLCVGSFSTAFLTWYCPFVLSLAVGLISISSQTIYIPSLFFYTLFLICLVFMDLFVRNTFSYSFYREKKMFVLFWAIAGHLVIVQKGWINFYLGMEMATIPFYALSSMSAHPLAIEGAVKYFIINAGFSILWLASFVLVWTGDIQAGYASVSLMEGACYSNLFLAMTGIFLSLKLGVFPCGYWVPDFYHISNRSVIIWMSFVPKYLCLVAIADILSLYPLNSRAQTLVVAFLVISTLWGHFGAILQKNVQRFLGYAAAAQIGFLCAPLIVQGSSGLVSALIYLIVYVVSLLGVLYGLQHSFLEDVQCITKKTPGYSLHVIAYFSGFLSLAGFPPFPGFFAKVIILVAVLHDLSWIHLAVFLGLSSLIGLFYYMHWILKVNHTLIRTDRGPLMV